MSTHIHTCMHHMHTCTRKHKCTHIHIHIHINTLTCKRHFSQKSCIGLLFGGTNEPHVWLCSWCRSGISSELLVSGSSSKNITSLVSCVTIFNQIRYLHSCSYMYLHVSMNCVFLCVRACACTCLCMLYAHEQKL